MFCNVRRARIAIAVAALCLAVAAAAAADESPSQCDLEIPPLAPAAPKFCTGSLFDDAAGIVTLTAARPLKAGDAVRLVQLSDGTAGVDALAPNIADEDDHLLETTYAITSSDNEVGLFDYASGPRGMYGMALYSLGQNQRAYTIYYKYTTFSNDTVTQVSTTVPGVAADVTRAHWAIVDNSATYRHVQMEPTLSPDTPFAFASGIAFDVQGYIYVLTCESRGDGAPSDYVDSTDGTPWAFTDLATLRMYSPTYELLHELSASGSPTLKKDLSNLNSAATLIGNNMEISGDRIFFTGQFSGIWSFGETEGVSPAPTTRARNVAPITMQARILPGHGGLEWVSVTTISQNSTGAIFGARNSYYTLLNGTSSEIVRTSPSATANVVYTCGRLEAGVAATFSPGQLVYDVAPVRDDSVYLAMRPYVAAIDTTSGTVLWARISTGNTLYDGFADATVDDEGVIHVVGNTVIDRDNNSTFTLGGVSLSQEVLQRAYALPHAVLQLSLRIRIAPDGTVLSVDSESESDHITSVSRTVDPDVMYYTKAQRGFVFVQAPLPALNDPYPEPSVGFPYGFSPGNLVEDGLTFGPVRRNGVMESGPLKYSDFYQSFGDGIKTADSRYMIVTDCTLWCSWCTVNNKYMSELALEFGGPPDSTGQRGFTFGCVPFENANFDPLTGDPAAQAANVEFYSDETGLGITPYTFCGWDEEHYQQFFKPGHNYPLIIVMDTRRMQTVAFQVGFNADKLRAIVEALDAEDYTMFSEPSFLYNGYMSTRGALISESSDVRTRTGVDFTMRVYESTQGYTMSMTTAARGEVAVYTRRSLASALKMPFVGIVREGAEEAGDFACVDFPGNVVRDLPQSLSPAALYWYGTTVQNNVSELSSVRYSHEAFAGGAIDEHTFIAAAAA